MTFKKNAVSKGKRVPKYTFFLQYSIAAKVLSDRSDWSDMSDNGTCGKMFGSVPNIG